MAGSYRDLRVWNLAMDFAEGVYHAADQIPRPELYGLAQQVKRAALSVASNIAEGKGRGTDPDYLRFLYQARGSLLEAETQILFAERMKYLRPDTAAALLKQSAAVGGSLAGLINSLHEMKQAAHV